MKKRILDKLRSKTGASITYALLLFLVCAVLCSVILAAATAASGRMAKMAEMDQRYYAVTSAAELLQDLFQKTPSVSVVEVKEITETTTYTEGEDPTSSVESTTRVYLVEGKKAQEIRERDYKNKDGTDIHYSTNNLPEPSFRNDTLMKDAALKLYAGTPLHGRALTLASQSSITTDAGLSYDALAVAVTENLVTDGDLKLTLYNRFKANGDPSGAGSRYTLELSYRADVQRAHSKKTKSDQSEALSETSYKTTTKTTDVTVTSWTWSLDGIKTISS